VIGPSSGRLKTLHRCQVDRTTRYSEGPHNKINTFVILVAKTVPDGEVQIREKTRRNSTNRISNNRLSELSTESESRKSSESLEVLGTPDSEVQSISDSSSMGLPRTTSLCTESVEVRHG